MSEAVSGKPGEDADAIAVRDSLIAALNGAIRTLGLTQAQAAERCGTDQPTLSKVLRGGQGKVSQERLLNWLAALGHDVVISVAPRRNRPGSVRVAVRAAPAQASA